MNHPLIILTLLALVLVACTIRIEPLGYKKPAPVKQRHHRHGIHRSAAAEGATYVSPAWLNEYHQLQEEHGGYTIPDDAGIQVNSQGKIKVPKSVVKHFHDLSRYPVKSSKQTTTPE